MQWRSHPAWTKRCLFRRLLNMLLPLALVILHIDILTSGVFKLLGHLQKDH